jgi:hypothetical protein
MMDRDEYDHSFDQPLNAVEANMEFEADADIQSHFGSYAGNAPHCKEHQIHRKTCFRCEGLIQRGAPLPVLPDPPKQLTIVIKRVVFDETVLVNEKVS